MATSLADLLVKLEVDSIGMRRALAATVEEFNALPHVRARARREAKKARRRATMRRRRKRGWR